MPSRIKNYVGRNYKKRRRKDRLSKKQRSNLMSKVRSKNTGLEKSFLRLLKKSNPREFSTHVRAIRGTPDVVFQKERVCVFLDGDFWHGWQFPRWRHQMKNKFWRDKIGENRRRDKRTHAFLRRNGWIVLRIWEHQIKSDPGKALVRVLGTQGSITPKALRCLKLGETNKSGKNSKTWSLRGSVLGGRGIVKPIRSKWDVGS